MTPRIIAMLQGLDGPGGVQRHSRSVARVLKDYAADHAIGLDVLSFTDADGWYDSRYLARPIAGCAGRRTRFVARALAELAKPHDLVVVGQVDFGPIALVSHVLRPRVPVVTLTYGIDVWRTLPLHKRAGLRIADRVVSISKYTAAKLTTEQGIDPPAITIIPCTMDEDFYNDVTAWQALGQAGIATRLLTISRMSKRDADKGIDYAIAALPAVRTRVPDVNYTIIGDGDDRPRLEQLARDCGVADIVRFAGRVPDQQLHAYLSGTDLFMLPSRKEGFGIVFLEAMAHGKAVIAGDHGGSPEVVIDGETGILVRHGNLAGLANAIIRLLLDPVGRRAMGEAGRRRVQSVYDYSHFSGSFGQTLNELLSQRN
jgi:phosphatidylinositol alpha-1,6-mannosyltransferase